MYDYKSISMIRYVNFIIMISVGFATQRAVMFKK